MMAKKPNLRDVENILTAETTLNYNWDEIEKAFENTLSRDGSTPNNLEADLDLNSYDLLNVNKITASDLLVSGTDITDTVKESQEAAATSATNAASSETKARNWAENAEDEVVDPDNYPGEYSALHHAAKAAESASAAALYDGPWVDDVAALLADTNLTYTAGQPGTVSAGDYVRTRKEGFAYEVAASGATDEHVTTAGGVKLYDLTRTITKTYTVGSGGDFATINAALTSLSARRAFYKVPQEQVTLELVSGFTMDEQVLVDSVDLGWIKITSVDATVTITGSSMESDTVTVDGTSVYYSFAAQNNGVLPIISVLFSVDGTGSLTPRVPLVITSGGRGEVTTGDGVQNAPDDAIRLDRGYLRARGAVFSGAGGYGAYLFNDSFLDAEQADFSGAGADGVLVTRNSRANLTEANVSGATVNGLLATQGAVVNAGEINAENCGGAGIRGRGSALINANSGDVSGCNDGIYADRACRISITDDTTDFDASGCTRYGLFVRNGAEVAGENINCNTSRVYVEKGGRLVAPGLSAVGAVNSVAAVLVETGGDLRAPNCTINNSGTGAAAALQCNAGSVYADGGTFVSSNQVAIYCLDGGVVRADGATITATNNAAVFAYGGDVIAPVSAINVVDNILIDTLDGGRVDLPSLTINRTGTAPGTSVRLRDGAHVNISGTAGENINVTANTITASGICIQ